MKKRDVWACEHGCKNDRVACEHLEALLPQMGYKRMPRVATDANVTFDVFKIPTWNKDVFIAYIKEHGITEAWAQTLLVNKYVHGLSNYQLVGEEGFTSEKTVRRLLKMLHARLERGGAKPRSGK